MRNNASMAADPPIDLASQTRVREDFFTNVMGKKYQFISSREEQGPKRTAFIDRAEIQLNQWLLPRASLKCPGMQVHSVGLQVASGIFYHRRVDGKQSDGWTPARTSWVVPAGSTLANAWNKQTEVLVLSLAPGLFDRILQDDGAGRPIELVPSIFGVDPFIAELLIQMTQNAVVEPFGSLLQDGLTTALVARLAQHAACKVSTAKGGLTPAQMRRVTDLIENRLSENLSLADLATEAGLSERYFCTMFRNTIGKTPYRYLIERRIERSKAFLLATHDMSVAHIAMAVGFQTSTHFATSFRNLTGVSPSSFRRHHSHRWRL